MPHPAMSPNHVAVVTGGASGLGLAAADLDRPPVGGRRVELVVGLCAVGELLGVVRDSQLECELERVAQRE